MAALKDSPSAIWGGATLGLAVGAILGFFVGSSYWTTLLYAILIGAGTGVVASVLGWIGDRARARGLEESVGVSHAATALMDYLAEVEQVRDFVDDADDYLSEHSPAAFGPDPTVATMCIAFVALIEEDQRWRVSYDSLDSFYAKHEARHPDIRVYASVSREFETNGPPTYPERVDAADWGAFVAERIAAHRATGASS